MMKKQNVIKTVVLAALIVSAQTSFAIGTDGINSLLGDSLITTSIKSKLLMNQSFSNLKLGMSTSQGVVSISGTVDSVSEASALVQAIAATNGVKDINTDALHVANNTQSLSDSMITAKIKGLFVRYKVFGEQTASAMPITVSTQQGVVSLSGETVDETALNKAITIAQSISGVKEVNTVMDAGENDSPNNS